MAFPTVVNSAAANSGANTTSFAFSFGFTATSGNLLMLCVSNDGGTGINAFSSPASWTFIGELNNTTNRLAVWCRVSDGTETGVTIGYPAAQGVAATIHEFSGYNSTANIEVSTFATGTSTSPDPPSLNPAGWGTEDTAWMAVCGWDANPHLTSYPTNYTVAQQSSEWNNATDGCGIAAAVRTDSQLASEDPGAFTIGSEDWIAITLAIRTNVNATGTATPTLSSFTSTASGTHTSSGASVNRLASISLSTALSAPLSIG